MSKESTEIKYLMRNQKAMMNFQLHKKMPNATKPTSPLISYLESIPPRDRVNLKNVKLSPKLGYQSSLTFPNAQLMLNFLKPSQWMVNDWPAKQYQIKTFQKQITKEIFDSAQETL